MAEKVDPPSGSPARAESPAMMRVVREEIPLSRREGEEIMKRRLSGESRSPSPPPFEPSSSTAIATETDTKTATSTYQSDSDLSNLFSADVSLLDMDLGYVFLRVYFNT